VGLKLNGTHQLVVYPDDVNLLRDKINTIKKNTHFNVPQSRSGCCGEEKNLLPQPGIEPRACNP
jgi:hypothetical protein